MKRFFQNRSLMCTLGGLLLFGLLLVPATQVFAASSQAQIPATGGFQQSCYSVALSGNSLTADCRPYHGSLVYSTLNIDAHYGNVDGTLTAGGSGFGSSCDDVYLSGTNNGNLNAHCLESNQIWWDYNTVNLNLHVANVNGHLVWQ
ncbi:hypothetical protein KDA_52490 [Dictyobacter alpinus]|uniref:Cyanovirin-N domain-containing protein n=2 Tax=Dictyobacter alpinus TaxID=2014873 RepID=A0A402BEG9_9CHLR|nr:hypothetical protein KDA_52490 [Dictyobacter alpinus]